MRIHTFSKAIALATTLTLLSACSLTTAPQGSTYWIKQGSDYQTHKDRIKMHDHILSCESGISDRVDAKKLTKDQHSALLDECMESKQYFKAQNWYDIKQTVKKVTSFICL